MQTIKLRSHVRDDGVLTIMLPQNLADTSVEVTIQPAPSPDAVGRVQEDLGWPAGFFDATFGSFRDEPITRGEQGIFEVREDVW